MSWSCEIARYRYLMYNHCIYVCIYKKQAKHENFLYFLKHILKSSLHDHENHSSNILILNKYY